MNCNCQIEPIHISLVNKVKNNILDDYTINGMSDFFKIFADNTRLKIINTLLISKMCVCDIANALDMSHSAISHQLRILKEFKIVKYVKVGKVVYYELDDEHIKQVFNMGKDYVNE